VIIANAITISCNRYRDQQSEARATSTGELTEASAAGPGVTRLDAETG